MSDNKVQNPDKPLVLADTEACKQLQKFLKQCNPNIEFLQADDLGQGVKGALAFIPSGSDKQEPQLHFGWRFAQPVKDVVKVPADKVADALNHCLDDRNFISADDLPKGQMGFLSYKDSIWLKFDIADVKKACAADAALGARVKAYSEALLRAGGLTRVAKNAKAKPEAETEKKA